MRQWRNVVGSMLAVVLLAVTLAACGSDKKSSSSSAPSTSSSSSTTASDTGSPAVQAAKADLAKFTKDQEPISVPPIGKAIPKGKTVAILTCPLPVCQTETKSADRAAKQLGWTPKDYNNPLTPEGYVAVWNQMIQTPPDGIIYIGVFPNALIKTQLAKVAKLKIPTIVIAPAGDKPSADGPILASYAGAPHFAESGRLMGVIVVADSGDTPPKTAFVYDKNLDLTLGGVRSEFTKTVEGAGGSVGLIQTSSQEIGKAVPGQVVSYLQAHPDVKYLATVINDFTAGIPQALKAAGLADKVKLVSRAPQASNLKDIEAGNQFASVGEENDTGGYRSIDALARIFVGKSDYDIEPVGWKQIITKDNVASIKRDTSGAPATPGSPATFLQAWGISG